MANKNPLCDYAGILKELQAGDSLPFTAGGLPAIIQDGEVLMTVNGSWVGSVALVSEINGWLLSDAGQLLIAGVL